MVRARTARSLLAFWVLFAVACSAPRWTNGVQSNEYYRRALGSGSTQRAADLQAQVGVASQAADVQLSVRDSVSTAEKFAEGRSELEQFAQSDIVGLGGRLVEKGTQIVAQYRRSDTMFVSYAVLPLKANAVIEREYSRRIGAARRLAFAPGLAQFKKNEPRKAWKILGAEAVGLAGWGVMSLLSSDLKDRRDRARRVSSYNYYDKWANRTGWGSLSMAVLAIGTYGFSALDGLFATPPKHQLLLTADGDMTLIVLAFSR